MKRTLYLPEELHRRVEAYLKIHPGITFSRLVQDALKARLGREDPRRLLRLAGIVTSAPTSARARAEDRPIARER